MPEIFTLSVNEVKNYTEDYCQQHFPERFAKAQRCSSDMEKLRILGVGILEYEKLGLEEKDIQKTEQGKPYSDKSEFQFSTSHSGDYIVLARGKENVGIDIERTDRKTRIPAGKVFTVNEQKWLEDNQEDGFIKLWTMKEAVSKLTGKGLAMDFKTLDVLSLLHSESIIIDEKIVFGKCFEMNNYTVSICSEEIIGTL